MTAQLVAATGLEAFVAALETAGAEPLVTAGLVVYTVTPVTGALARQAVRTGVAVGEVTPWPLTPPHWIHLPAEVRFASTSVDPSPLAGWQAHSRDIGAWGTVHLPTGAWLAHVRGVLGRAS